MARHSLLLLAAPARLHAWLKHAADTPGITSQRHAAHLHTWWNSLLARAMMHSSRANAPVISCSMLPAASPGDCGCVRRERLSYSFTATGWRAAQCATNNNAAATVCNDLGADLNGVRSEPQRVQVGFHVHALLKKLLQQLREQEMVIGMSAAWHSDASSNITTAVCDSTDTAPCAVLR